MTELTMKEHGEKLLEKERELWDEQITAAGKKLLWFFSGCLVTAIVMFAISMF